MTDTWLTYANPRFDIRWRYPMVTPAGHSVDVIEDDVPDTRVHLVTRESTEVYFEVRRMVEIAPEAEYAEHAVLLAERFGQESIAVGPLVSEALAGVPAHRYEFAWGDRARSVVLLRLEATLYRVSTTGIASQRAILATVTIGSFEHLSRDSEHCSVSHVARANRHGPVLVGTSCFTIG